MVEWAGNASEPRQDRNRPRDPSPNWLAPRQEQWPGSSALASRGPSADLDHEGHEALPIEIAFLERYGVDRGLLHAAARLGRMAGVTADRALLADGPLSAQTFYELLAVHVGLPHLRHPVAIRADSRVDWSGEGGVAPLVWNPAGHTYAMAPRGLALAALLHRFDRGEWKPDVRVAITSPQRFSALVRLHRRPAIVRDASHALPDWNARLSAHAGWSFGQRAAALGVGTATGCGIGFAPEATFQVACLAFSLVFLAMIGLRLLAAASSGAPTTPTAARLPDHLLPVYTIVVPLYRESGVVPRLVAALSRIDYPPARLDIKIVVETGDDATLHALQAERLPDRFEVLRAPPGRPQTKPRALNVALQFAIGRYLVVYDAEDDPEPDQLRAAAACFTNADAKLACLQARLAIDNNRDSWLSRGIMAQTPQAF